MEDKNTKSFNTILTACDYLESLGWNGDTIRGFINSDPDGISVVSYQKDNTVFTPDQFMKALGVICNGELCSRKRIAGGDYVMRNLSAGDVFGVAALFGDATSYVSTINARTDATVVYFSEAFLEDLFHQHPECAIVYIQLLSKKIRYLNVKLDGFTTPNAYSKLALFLFENNGYRGSMSSLAEELDISRMTLYRNLDLLVEEGAIEKSGKSIRIINPDISHIFSSSDEIL